MCTGSVLSAVSSLLLVDLAKEQEKKRMRTESSFFAAFYYVAQISHHSCYSWVTESRKCHRKYCRRIWCFGAVFGAMSAENAMEQQGSLDPD